MAIGGYVGVNDTPRKIVDMYVGVANQPRRVLKAYIGDAQNQPRLWYYLCNTIPEMTSNSSPRGQVICSDLQGVTGVGTSVIAAGTDKSYYVFTSDNTVGIAHMNENIYGYIEYDFDHSVSVSEVDFSAGVGSMSGYYKDFIVRIDLYTNDTWSTYGRSTISSPEGVLPAPMSNYTVQNGTVYNVTKIRLTFETMKTYGNGVVMNKIQIKN